MTFTFGELIQVTPSDTQTALQTFQHSAWKDVITGTHVYTVPVDKKHWTWIHKDRFWTQDIHSDIKAWIADYSVHAKQGKFKILRTKINPKSGETETKEYTEPAIHFLDRRRAISCKLRWGNDIDPVKMNHINNIGTLPHPGELMLRKDQLKELSRLKKLIEKYGYNLPA